MLIGDENRRTIEGALAQNGASRCGARAAQRHRQITSTRENVDRVNVHEATAVIANVDHDTVFRVVLGIEIDVQLVERVLRHVEHVRVTEPAVAYLCNCLLYTSDAADERSSVDL